MRHIYIITILVAVIGIISTILVLTTMQTQSLISEMKSFKENIIEVNNMLKEENEQLRYQIRWLSAMMKLDSSPTIENPISNNLSEIPMVTIVKGRISGVTEEKNLVIRNNDEFTQLWEEIYSVSGKLPVPEIDFTTVTLLAAFNGERSNDCHDIMIKKIEVISGEEHMEHFEHYNSQKVVMVTRFEPSSDAVCQEVHTQAYHIVANPFSLEDITFVTSVEKIN
tara:strand:- start:600 stop:1271 length:672 start_codon:yes stop_codon:yes gene_type:complete